MTIQSSTSQVAKTNRDMNVVTGFSDDAHLGLMIGDFINSLNDSEKKILAGKVEATRLHVKSLKSLQFETLECGLINHPYIESIKADPVFIECFGKLRYRFVNLKLSKIIVLQPFVYSGYEAVPSGELERLQYAFPNNWDVPIEMCVFQPGLQFQMTSSHPALSKDPLIKWNPDGIQITPQKNINLIQVKHFSNKYYMFNGYHRIVNAIKSGLTHFPCLVVDANSMADLAFPQGNFFPLEKVSSAPRPAYMSDFHTAATIDAKGRDLRFGWTISIDFKRIQMPI